MKRKTAKELREIQLNLNHKLTKVNTAIRERLLTLSEKHPDAIVAQVGDTQVKAKSITTNYVHNISINECLAHIEHIENWVNDNQTYIQTKIEFNNLN